LVSVTVCVLHILVSVVNTPLMRSGMAHVLKGSQFYLHTANGLNHTIKTVSNSYISSIQDITTTTPIVKDVRLY